MPRRKSSEGLQRAGDLIPALSIPKPDESVRIVSKRAGKHAVQIEAVRTAREEARQELGYSSRPFILCGLPVRRPKSGALIHVRRNGQFFLRVAGDPEFGLPFGQDRLIPIWVATLAVRQKDRTIHFNAAADMLETFGLPKDGKTYRRLIEGFQRVFASTIYFGTEQQLRKRAVSDWERCHYFDRLRVWYTDEPDQRTLPDDEFRNTIVLSEWFWNELLAHPIPVDLAVVRALASAPGNLDFYLWLVWRCWKAKGTERIPLFGAGGLLNQLGVEGYTSRPRRLRQRLRHWLDEIRASWPECPAALADDGEHLVVSHAQAITGGS